MNKLSKIFLIIIIILIIVIIGMYMNMIKISKNNLNQVLNNAQEVFEMNKAINGAGFSLEKQEDGSYILVEKTDI